MGNIRGFKERVKRDVNKKYGIPIFNQEEQDLQLGGLLKLGLGLLAGQQQEDLGFKGGFAGGVNWGAQQDLGFGFNGGFSTPFGGATGGFGWNQEQEDLFFGLLPSLIGGLMGGARTQDQEDLQNLGDIMKIAGPLLQQLAPLALDALSKAGQQE